MKKISVLLSFVLLTLATLGQGIRFVSSFEEALKKASDSKKPVSGVSMFYWIFGRVGAGLAGEKFHF